ncbi:twin-arginine translocase TatA/TatE family subunit [Terricaulis sp.]|uniref:twin-arginine translocase TatA/TatE family subunit n=1 Tax=Terricaulis sp. TaxID=2768686 RepID=UPI003784B6FA
MHPSWTLIIVVVLAALLFMRPGKLSGLMEDLGKGIKGFRKGMSDDQQQPPPPAEPPRQVADQTTQQNANQDRVQN